MYISIANDVNDDICGKRDLFVVAKCRVAEMRFDWHIYVRHSKPCDYHQNAFEHFFIE